MAIDTGKVVTGLQVWVVVALLSASLTFMGLWPWRYLFAGMAAYLAMMVIAAYVGAMLYREEAA